MYGNIEIGFEFKAAAKCMFRRSFQTVEKPLSLIKKGSQGRSPRQGLGAVAPVKSPFPGERGQGDRDSKLEVCFKNRLFLQAETRCQRTSFFIFIILLPLLHFFPLYAILILNRISKIRYERLFAR